MFELKGPVRAIHQFVNMSSEEVDYKVPGTGEVIRGKGCKPAMGHTFSSGTVDGPGLFTFETGSTISKNPLWNLANQLVPKPSREQVNCHAEKSILISTGEVSVPTSVLTFSPLSVEFRGFGSVPPNPHGYCRVEQ